MFRSLSVAACAAAAGVFLAPVAAQAAPAPFQPAPVGNLRICAAGAPAFARVIPQSEPQGPSMSVGVQDGQCTTLSVAAGRVWVFKLSSSASSKFCGPAMGNSCFEEQGSYDEVSWDDSFSSGRTGGNEIEVVVEPAGGPIANVTFWSGSAW